MATNSELTYADLEIRILKREEAGYPVEITLPSDAYYKRGFLSPDLPTGGDARQMGARLAAWFFADATVRAAWAYARGRYPQRRVRLCLDEDVPELHVLPWEALRDSEHGLDLAAVDATPFSRFLAGEWQGYDPVSTWPIKILAVIANPDDLGGYNLAALDEEAEWTMLREAMEGLAVTLARLPPPCTLAAIERELRQGYHVLHIIAHGAYSERRGQAALYLVDAENHVQVVREDDFAAMLARQLFDGGVHSPEDYLRLVFLASCQSATRDTADAFRGLAPALVNARVPAVVAMQDTVSITAARTFSHAFYEGLVRHGLVDLAGNQARATLLTSGSGEAATPVIFMRGSGKLFEPHAQGQQHIARKPFEPETMYIPAGAFLMGSPAGDGVPEEETPQHEVTLPAYRIGKYPVTNVQYAEFLKRERAQEPPRKAGWFLREPPADKGDHPVVGVSWHDALAYCRWLSEATGRSYRLPTEAEWEKAARGPTGQTYPWGDGWEEGRCNAEGGDTTSVMAYPQGASPYGCWDMAGNVQEWVSTLWGSERQTFAYPYRDDDGREDLQADAHLYRITRVHRGGAFRDDPPRLRCSARGRSSASGKVHWRGFRVALDI